MIPEKASLLISITVSPIVRDTNDEHPIQVPLKYGTLGIFNDLNDVQ